MKVSTEKLDTAPGTKLSAAKDFNVTTEVQQNTQGLKVLLKFLKVNSHKLISIDLLSPYHINKCNYKHCDNSFKI